MYGPIPSISVESRPERPVLMTDVTVTEPVTAPRSVRLDTLIRLRWLRIHRAHAESTRATQSSPAPQPMRRSTPAPETVFSPTPTNFLPNHSPRFRRRFRSRARSLRSPVHGRPPHSCLSAVPPQVDPLRLPCCNIRHA